MQADVFVLHHDAAGAQCLRNEDRLREVVGRHVQLAPQVGFFFVFGEGEAVDGADVDAGVAFDAFFSGENGFYVAVEAALRLFKGGLGIEAEFNLQLVAVDGLFEIHMRDEVASILGHHARVAPVVDAHLLADQVDAGVGAPGNVLPLEEQIDRQRGLVTLGDGGNDVLRTEGRIAPEKDFRMG